jgi:hypothetical protein
MNLSMNIVDRKTAAWAGAASNAGIVVLLSLGMVAAAAPRAHAQSTTLPGTLSGTTVALDATSGTATVLGASTLSGTVSFTLNFGVEYLAVGGGGGSAGGGGGAGGVRTNLGTPLYLTSQSYQAVVGVGGLGGNIANGTSGSSSASPWARRRGAMIGFGFVLPTRPAFPPHQRSLIRHGPCLPTAIPSTTRCRPVRSWPWSPTSSTPPIRRRYRAR